MNRISAYLRNSDTMTAQSEDKRNSRKEHELKIDVCKNTCTNDIPFKMFHPLLISMTMFGLLHVSGTEKRWKLITKIYSTTVLLLLWVMFFKSFTMYGMEEFGPNFLLKITMHSWTLQCAAAATATYMACRNQNKLTAFLTRWSKLLRENRSQPLKDANNKIYVRKANVKFYLLLTLTWLGFLALCSSLAYGSFVSNVLDLMLSPVDPKHALLVKCLFYVMNVYMCAAWVFTLCLYWSMGSVIYEEFRIFHEDFEKAVHPNGNIVGIGIYRRRHQGVCLLVEKADDVLSGFSAVSIVVCTLTNMFILYNILWYNSLFKPVMLLIAAIFWFISTVVYLVIIAVGGGYINHMAHAPFKTIHNIDLKTISAEVSFQINMFIAKLTGESIGLTAMGMFVIDKPTILTISGVFLTYFIVLVQFRQPVDQLKSFPNCTYSIG